MPTHSDECLGFSRVAFPPQDGLRLRGEANMPLNSPDEASFLSQIWEIVPFPLPREFVTIV